MNFRTFVQENLVGRGRCPVCALPLPSGVHAPGGSTCSRRCTLWRRKFGEVTASNVEGLAERILARVRQLTPGSTVCPGKLAADLFDGDRDALATLRPVLFYLAALGHLRLSQQGRWVRWDVLKGPYRVGKPRRAGKAARPFANTEGGAVEVSE